MFSKNKNLFKIDFIILITLIVITIMGLVNLYSATYSLKGNFIISQSIATAIGFIVMTVVIFIDLDFFKKLYIPIYTISIILLVAVNLFGRTVNGAKAWLKIPGIPQFQPSEFVKIAMIICLATILDKHKDDLNKPKVLIKILIFAFLPIALIFKQPDLGTGFVFIFITFAMLFMAGISFKLVVYSIFITIFSIPIFYFNLSFYQKNRILNFLYPERDISDTGYQAVQGKIAVGSGKFSGRGYLSGPQNQFNFIPEKQTDSIFPVFVEEMGFIGGITLIASYSVLIYRFLKISRKTSSIYKRLIIIGVAAMFLVHVFENIGMTIGIMPITGIPLPFFSYGGTFQIINLIAIGMVQSIACEKRPLDFI